MAVISEPLEPLEPPLPCPACGGANSPDAVFCGNPACRKALGEFRYSLEEELGASRWHERIADRVAGFVGKPHFLVVHAAWFLAWVVLNTGLVAVVGRFDDYPFALLGILLSIEAIFMTGFLLISSNRQSAHANLRAELDYEVNVRTYRAIQRIDRTLGELTRRLERLEAVGPVAGPAPPASSPGTRGPGRRS